MDKIWCISMNTREVGLRATTTFSNHFCTKLGGQVVLAQRDVVVM
jgi:hypothetical protein